MSHKFSMTKSNILKNQGLQWHRLYNLGLECQFTLIIMPLLYIKQEKMVPFPPPRTSCIGLSRSKSFPCDVEISLSESEDVLCAMFV